ncbi:putative diacylglycerol kinase [Dirofilaria immitis]
MQSSATAVPESDSAAATVTLESDSTAAIAVSEFDSSVMKKRRNSLPILISDHIYIDESSKQNFEAQKISIDNSIADTTTTATNTITAATTAATITTAATTTTTTTITATTTSTTDRRTKNLQKTIGKANSLTNSSSVKMTISRNHLSTQLSDNSTFLPKTSKKPLLIRAEAIDLPYASVESTNDSSNNSNNSINSKMKHDIRPHLFVSFLTKHFEKMHKKMKPKRPLGSSLSFDLDERQGMRFLEQQHKTTISSSNDNNSIDYSNLFHSNLNCFHCLLDISLRERKFHRLNNNGTRFWSSSDTPIIHDNHSSSEYSSQKFTINNYKRSLHDSSRFINNKRALAKTTAAKRLIDVHSSQFHGAMAAALCKHRTKNYWFDANIHADEHIWMPSLAPCTISSSCSRDTECYVGERDCRKIGEKRSCAACHIVVHAACLPILRQLYVKCKITYQEDNSVRKLITPSRNIVDESLNGHHWLHKWKQEGRCLRCGKSFQQKIFHDKEVIAITCSWCKRSYHNKMECFSSQRFERSCDRGELKEIIVPPTWIQYSNQTQTRKRKKITKRKKRRLFRIRPMPMDDGTWLPSQPLLVFVNPKSGGNKGSKLLHTFCWLLNPRQVFDITVLKGPEFGLGMFKKVASNLRVLVCGGDGTVGWILSTLDKMNWQKYPPIGIVPLGTGNDLARCLGWGGSFSEEPLAQVLSAVINETSITYLDRWKINVEPNLQASNAQTDEIDKAAQNELTLTVMNNYYSIGADAHVALQFHHSRSANPQMLNSRLKNRIAYGGLGTIDLFKRTWKLLHEYITLECDGVDLTPKIREFKFHCILFLNITYYAGGTIPWGNDDEEKYRPSSCDGKLEILGFTTATLATLQMGGKGERIAQCSHARITTSKAIPMQVDGEPCLLAPSTIEITFHSQVPMLRREKKSNYMPGVLKKQRKISRQHQNYISQAPLNSVGYSLPVLLTTSIDYNTNRDNLERLKVTAMEIGKICVEAEAELDNIRQKIDKIIADYSDSNIELSSEWRFLDYVSSAEEGVFRVHRYQEQFMTLSDICCLEECIMIVNNVLVKQIQQSTDDASNQVRKNNISDRDDCLNDEALHITFQCDTNEAHL